MKGQLAFHLPANTAMTRAEFFVSPVNALALAAIDGWLDWPGGKMILAAPSGAGKTHLAQIWASDTNATLIDAIDILSTDLPALAEQGPVGVEDAEAVAGSSARQEALFHLHNLMAERGHALFITAAAPPRDWGLTLPDLTSRLLAAPLTRLDPPDDALLSAVLVKLFADRQTAVPPALIAWLVTRMDRSIKAARAIVARLDAAALAQRRPITRALAAELLDSD